jgi:hypothetical protein
MARDAENTDCRGRHWGSLGKMGRLHSDFQGVAGTNREDRYGVLEKPPRRLPER